MKKFNIFLSLFMFFASMVSLSAAQVYKEDNGTTLDLYGRLQQGFGDYETTNMRGIGDKALGFGDVNGVFDARLGIAGKKVINNYVSLIGKAEYQVGAGEYANSLDPNAHSLTARYVYTGLDFNKWGKITLGRVESGAIMFSDTVDIFTKTGAHTAGTRASFVDKTAAQTYRQDSTAQYSISTLGFDISAAYAQGNATSEIDYMTNGSIRYNLDTGYGILKPVVTYQYTKGTKGVNEFSEYRYAGEGLSYDLGALHLGAIYSWDSLSRFDGQDLGHNKAFELAASYIIANKYRVLLGYMNMQNDHVDVRDSSMGYTDGIAALDHTGNATIMNEFTIEANYMFSESSFAYISYSARLGDANTSYWNSNSDADRLAIDKANKNDNAVAAGLRYEF